MNMTDTPTLGKSTHKANPVKTRVAVKINGQLVQQEVTPRTHLGDFLRDQVRLTGTHLGCEHGVCGACVVLLDGKPVRSCITYAAACDGHAVTTIEGFESDPVMARLRQAFTEHHALQCGYCTPGMLATSRDIVLRLPDADERTVRAELSGNLCRCTGYVGIVGAVISVLSALKQQVDPDVERLRALVKAGHSASLASVVSVAEVHDLANTVTHASGSAAASGTSTPLKHATAAAGTAFQGFEASNQATPSTTPPSNIMEQQPSGTQIQEVIELPFPSDQVWQLMVDLPAVSSCLPGATVTGMAGDQVNGSVSVKFGPMKASFEGQATLSKDDMQRQATLVGTGRDRLSQSQATGRVGYRLESLSTLSTRVHIQMDYSLQGPLAQFSRSGMVQEFVRRLIQDFAKNVSHVLANPGSPASMPSKEIHPVSLFFSILMNRLRRLFSIGKK